MVPYDKNVNRVKNPYQFIKDGEKVSMEIMENALNLHTSIANGYMILLKPSKEYYDKLKDMISYHEEHNTQFGYVDSLSGIDEQAIVDIYHKDKVEWFNMDPYNCISPWHVNRIYPSLKLNQMITLHYLHDKPWEEGEGSKKWPDTAFWWINFDNLIKKISPKFGEYLISLIPDNIYKERLNIIKAAKDLLNYNIDDDVEYPSTLQNTKIPVASFRDNIKKRLENKLSAIKLED